MPCSSNPRDYQHTNYQVTTDIEEILDRPSKHVTQEERIAIQKILDGVEAGSPRTQKEFNRLLREQHRQHKCDFVKTSKQRIVYLEMVASRPNNLPNTLIPFLCLKKKKSKSGVLVVTVVTSPHPKDENGVPQPFTCEWNCYYCPNEPGQPRSYLHDEPSVLRANTNGFDPVLQFTDRVMTLAMNGHPPDKIELIVLGGTWNSYPLHYRETFMRDIFYAANTLFHRPARGRLLLAQEKHRNESAQCKIIGVTLETRPDCVDVDTIRHFRRVGCTRVQLGLQHTDDRILKRINRGCTTADAKLAIRLLKNSGYKVDVHLMPQLPFATVEDDYAMMTEMLGNPHLQADQWKIYPCMTVPWTVIRQWADSGKYKAYSDRDLIDLLKWTKSRVHPWVRLNRVVRDIPAQYILTGNTETNLREVLQREMKCDGLRCRCIRCREVGLNPSTNPTQAVIQIRPYQGSPTDYRNNEYFLSMEEGDSNETLHGFLRLRMSPGAMQEAYPEYAEGKRIALVRELHVYGQLVEVDSRDTSQMASQHIGHGKYLMEWAEKLSRREGYTHLAVIAGVGTRNYYRKLGYHLTASRDGEMMVKEIYQVSWTRYLILSIILLGGLILSYYGNSVY